MSGFDGIEGEMVLASGWYISGTFWAAAGTIAVLATGTIAIIVAITQANPVRRLECSMSVAPLLPGSAQDMSGKLQLTWDGNILDNAHILEVNLFNRGRRDISKEDFDHSLEFRVGGKILGILRASSGPSSSTFRAVGFDGDVLQVGPGLIRRRQSIKVTLVAIGSSLALSSSADAVRDVDVKVLEPDQSDHRHPVRIRYIAGTGVVALMAGLVLIGLVIGNRLASPGNGHSDAGSNQADTAATGKGDSTPQVSASVSAALRTAEADLDSRTQTMWVSGISALHQIMRNSPGAQPDALDSLASFIRKQSPAGSNDQPIANVVQLALNALMDRDPANDNGAIVNLSETNLTNANLDGINLVNANLVDTDFTSSNLNDADLQGANLNYAFVGGATMNNTNVNGANLSGASFYQTPMCHGSQATQPERGYNCSASGL